MGHALAVRIACRAAICLSSNRSAVIFIGSELSFCLLAFFCGGTITGSSATNSSDHAHLAWAVIATWACRNFALVEDLYCHRFEFVSGTMAIAKSRWENTRSHKLDHIREVLVRGKFEWILLFVVGA